MRQRIPLAIGRGVDRATGLVAVHPGAPIDARNVYARDAKMAFSPGLAQSGYPPLDWGTDVVCLFGMQSTLDLLEVVYDRVTGELRLFRVDTINNVLQPIAVPTDGIWGTLTPGVDFPVVVADEADGKAFFAHAEPIIGNRLPTIVYTPDIDPTLVGSFAVLQADLDGAGDADVYFSFVKAYNSYMGGSGFGSASEPDRGDVLRLSLPGQPTIFEQENFALCGVKGDPILALDITTGALSAIGGAQSVLVAGKGSQLHRLIGSSFDDFEFEVLDAEHGVVSARAFVNTGDTLFCWSNDGPRLVTPTASDAVGQPLELISPLPQDFAPLGPSRTMFGFFDKKRYCLEYYFPNIEDASVPVPGFCLSLWNPKDPRWTFRERFQPIICAGRLLTAATGAQPDPPDGYASDLIIVDDGIAADARYRTVLVSWTNNLQTGTETVQIFAKIDGGAWSRVMAVPVGGAAQSASWATALPVGDYDVAIRYVNVSTPGSGYAGNDPDAWTAITAPGARTTVTTTSAGILGPLGSFSEATRQVSLSWACAQIDVPFLLQKDIGGGWVDVASGFTATSYIYTPPDAELNTTINFRVFPARGAILGPVSGTLAVVCNLTIGTAVLTNPMTAGPDVIGPVQKWVVTAAVAAQASGPITSYDVEISFNGSVVANFSEPRPGHSFPPASISFNTGLAYPAGHGITVSMRIRGRNASFFGLWSNVASVVV